MMKSNEEKVNNNYQPEEKNPPHVVRTVKEMNPEEQPREKAEKYGCGNLTTVELWALILRIGSQGHPVTELCRQMMEQNDYSLHKLERRTRRELMKLKGIGGMKCTQVLAVMELIRRYCLEDIPKGEIITGSNQIYKRLGPQIGNLDHEEIWLLLLNRRNEVIKEMNITTGSSTASIFDIKKIIKHALLENAESLILTHNHPSGNLRPSPADDKITRDLNEACKIMNLIMLDHIIITHSGYYSYKDSGRL